MIYNTKSITNTTNERFTGRFDGVDIVLEPEQVRFLPSFVSEHIAEQLIKSIIIEKKKKGKADESAIRGEFLIKILGEEIKTIPEKTTLSLKQRIELHEKEYKEFVDNQELEKIKQKKQILNV